MKKIFVATIAFCLLAAAPAAAQFNWGVKAGVNLAQKPSSLDDAAKGKTGFFVGPMAKVIIPVINLGLEGNILYSQSNTELDGNSTKRHSIEVPIYLRYDFALPILSKIVEPFVAVGPQFGWVIGDGDESWKNAAGDVYSWEYKKSNLSLNLGLGATLISHIQLHINYNIALGNTGEYKEDLTSAGLDYITGSKTNTWQISAAYIF